MDLIQRFRSFAAVLHERARHSLKPARSVACSTAFLLALNAANAFCEVSIDDWDRLSGPIPIVNQAPTQLLFLQPIPDRAETYPKSRCSLSLNTAITNTLQWGKSENYYGYTDMETIRTCMEVKYGLFSGVEIGMSIPFVYTSGGFMDRAILEFEKLFNVVRNLREKEDQYGRADSYTYFIEKNDETFIEGKENSAGLGDLVLKMKGKIWDEGSMRPCLSARFSVKIPTGDEDRAFGSGEVDYGFGLLLQKTIGRVTAYLNADVILPGHAFEQAGVSVRKFCETMLGVEYKFSERFSGLTQLYYITRPFEDTGLEMLDRRMWNLLLGVSYLTKTGICIQGGFVEDFFTSSNTGADITFFLNVGKNF